MHNKLLGQFLAFAGAFLLIGGPCWAHAGRFAFLAGIGLLAAGVVLARPWSPREDDKPPRP